MEPTNKQSKNEDTPKQVWQFVWKSDRHRSYLFESDLYITPELFVEYINEEINEYKSNNPFDEPCEFNFETYTLDDLNNGKYVIFTNKACGHTFKIIEKAVF